MSASVTSGTRSARDARLVAGLALITVALISIFTIGVASRASEDPAGSGPVIASLGMTAAVILAMAFVIPTAFTWVDVRLTRGWPYIVGGVSALIGLMGWLLVVVSPATGAAFYRAIRLPQGVVQFWDLRLTLETVDCARWGFNVFETNNGCLADPSIYGPGITWWRFTFGLLTESNTTVWGLLVIVGASIALAWVAKQSFGLAAVVLLAAAVGAPWQLLLERANVDALVLMIAVFAVWLTRRWNSYWAWSIAALAIWLAGTWKYYPFVLAILLLPVVGLRRGWIVLAGFAAATVAFFVLTWDNVLLSLAASSGMAELGDFVVLGRIPVVARLPETWSTGDVLLVAICLVAIAWGWFLGRTKYLNAPSQRVPVWVLLALAGGLLYLSSVALTGFAYGYKAAFLVLLVPGLRVRNHWPRIAVWSTLVAIALVLISFVVVWNTVLATLAGVVVSSLVVGQATYVLFRWCRALLSPENPSIPAGQSQ